MQTEAEIRSWSDVGIGWVLCCGFGDQHDLATRQIRPLLRRQTFGGGWVIAWCRQEGPNDWVIASGGAIAETEEQHSVERAMCWALEELLRVANDRAALYNKQQHVLTNELLRILGRS